MPLKLVMGLGFALALTTGAAVVTDAHAGTCRKDAREISLSKDNVVRLNDYLCRSDRDPQAEVRVQFQRLSGLAAGALLNSGTAPWHEVLYGKHRIVSNDVLKEYRNLITRFASAVRAKEDVNLRVNVAEQPATDDQQGTYVTADKGVEIRSFRLPELPEIPLVDETVEILTKQTWPTSLNMHYSISGNTPADENIIRSPLDEMTVWRYLTLADLKDYSRRLERYNALVVDRQYGTRKRVPKALQFLEYLTAGGWPETFLYSFAQVDRAEPCIQLDFRTHQYSYVVDIAVIENVSSKAIQVDQLLGRSGGGNQLRQVSKSSARIDGSALQAEAVTLAPAERLIVALGIVFEVDPYQLGSSRAEEEERSRVRFQKIMASRPGTVFRTEVYSALRGNIPAKDDTFAIRKMRESFKPPSFPTHSDFAFGPEWALTGLALGGERILFDAVAPNFLEITAGLEVGSCPILYAWSKPDAVWFRHGKIIHQAQTQASQASETVTFDGFVHRFRIAEEELERATIAGVKLAIELADGNTVTLLPESASFTAGNAIELYANDEIEIDFALTGNLKESDVVRSRLTVTGYYDRYPALLLSRH